MNSTNLPLSAPRPGGKILKRIQRDYPEAVRATIWQGFKPRKGWFDVLNAPATAASLKHMRDVLGVTSVQFCVKTRAGIGGFRFPDYQISELIPGKAV